MIMIIPEVYLHARTLPEMWAGWDGMQSVEAVQMCSVKQRPVQGLCSG